MLCEWFWEVEMADSNKFMITIKFVLSYFTDI